MTAIGMPPMPKVRDSARPSGANSSLQITAVGMPLFSNSMVSWRLHDVHEPQSPTAVTTASQ